MWLTFIFCLKDQVLKLVKIGLIENIQKYVDKQIVCGVFKDPEKAFSNELDKLSYYGIKVIENRWFKLYLSNQIQYVS